MKDKIVTSIFVSILLFFSLTSLFIKDKEISTYERRKLMTKDTLKEDFIANLDDYMKDQFFLRDMLISINSTFDRYILNKFDSNDIYIKNGYLIEKNYPLNETNIANFIKKLNFINETYLKNSNVFYAIIPDKSYFLADNKYLKIDYNSLLSKIGENINNIDYIDIIDLLKLEDYYKTDIHIRQEEYPKIVKRLGEYLNFTYQDNSYKLTTYNNFHGASYKKAALFTKPDNLTILRNKKIENAQVKHLEYGPKPVYELDKLEDIDAYNVYLGGPSSFIEIENTNSSTNKELIIFRDSFGSSLAPLLIEYYQKITLIDLRYIKMDIASSYLDFTNKDVLFLYSTIIINNSNLLKVNYK